LAEHWTAEHRTAEHRTAEHRTAEHRTAEHRAAEHRTARRPEVVARYVSHRDGRVYVRLKTQSPGWVSTRCSQSLARVVLAELEGESPLEPARRALLSV